MKKRYPRGTWMKLTSKDTLKALMAQKNRSYSQMARYAGCSRSFVSHLATGRKTSCTVALAHRIAEALDVPLEILFVPQAPSASSKIANRRRAAA